jgi:ectoine hydroxylase
MIFNEKQIAQYRTDGWLAVPDFWNGDEVRAMQAEVERFKTDGILKNVATNGDGKSKSQTKMNLQLCPISPHSALFRAMPFAPKVIEAVTQLIGEPVLLHLDQGFLKPGGHGAGTNWHQDNAYFKIGDPLKGVALWTAVHEATAANGTMRVIPRAFNRTLEHTRDPDSNHHIRCFPDEGDALTVELPAGGALFFAYGTPHATGANGTRKERAGVALHFINDAVSQEAMEGFEPGTRPYLNGPEATGGKREYGVQVAGTWDAEVRQAGQIEVTFG